MFFFDNVRKEEERKPGIALTGQAGRWSDAGGNDAVNSSSPLLLKTRPSHSECAGQKKAGGGGVSPLLSFFILSRNICQSVALFCSLHHDLKR